MLVLAEALGDRPQVYPGASAQVKFFLELDQQPVDADALPVAVVQGFNGFTLSSTVLNSDGVGVYAVNFTPLSAGQYRVMLTAYNNGVPVVSMTVVHAQEYAPVVSVAEARAHLRIEHTDADALLERAVRVATRQCEDVTGRAWWRRAVSDVVGSLSPSRTLFVLPQAPIISVESVTAVGAILTGWSFDPAAGILELDSVPSYSGTEPVRVAYTVGPLDGIVPDNIRQGILEVMALYYARQRGGSNLPAQTDMGPSPWALPLTVSNSYRTGLWDTIRMSSF
jgi:uncharacterized phiE125 gp8 family phage protein